MQQLRGIMKMRNLGKMELTYFSFKREPYKTETTFITKSNIHWNRRLSKYRAKRPKSAFEIFEKRLKYFCRERTTTRLKTIWDERYRKTRPFVVDELHLEVGGKRPRISFSTVTGNASKKANPRLYHRVTGDP